MARKRRGSSMGKGTKRSRKTRKTGRKYLSMPDGWNLYKAEPGSIKIDILPYIVGDVKTHPEGENMAEDVWYRFPYKLHGSVGPNRTTLVCPSTIGKPCPVCEKRQEIFDDPDMDNKAAGKFRASPRSLFVIKVKGGDDKKAMGKKFIWDISDFCFFDQMDVELDHGEEEWNDFACLEGGYTLKVRLLEESFDGNKYPKCDRIDFIERKDYNESILDKLPCLDDVIIPNIKTYNEIEAILEGEEEEEETPKEKSKKKTSKKSTKKSAKKSKSKKKDKKKYTWEDLAEMDEDELEELVEKLGMDLDEDDWEDESELRILVAEELEIEPEEEDPDDDGDDDEPEPEEKPKSKKKDKKSKAKKKDKKKKKGGCPHGHDFGAEFGDHEECNEEDCDQHDPCFEKYDELMDED